MNTVSDEEGTLDGLDLLLSFKLPATFLKVCDFRPLSAGFVGPTEHLSAHLRAFIVSFTAREGRVGPDSWYFAHGRSLLRLCEDISAGGQSKLRMGTPHHQLLSSTDGAWLSEGVLELHSRNRAGDGFPLWLPAHGVCLTYAWHFPPPAYPRQSELCERDGCTIRSLV